MYLLTSWLYADIQEPSNDVCSFAQPPKTNKMTTFYNLNLLDYHWVYGHVPYIIVKGIMWAFQGGAALLCRLASARKYYLASIFFIKTAKLQCIFYFMMVSISYKIFNEWPLSSERERERKANLGRHKHNACQEVNWKSEQQLDEMKLKAVARAAKKCGPPSLSDISLHCPESNQLLRRRMHRAQESKLVPTVIKKTRVILPKQELYSRERRPGLIVDSNAIYLLRTS